MSMNPRRRRRAAAASLAGVTLFPITAAMAAGDVSVAIDKLAPQDVVSGPNVAVEAEFSSRTARNISRVEFLVDGQVASSYRLEQPLHKGHFIFGWDTTRLDNSVHTIEARAYDEQGKVGSTQLQLFVDNQAIDQARPVLRITAPREGAVVSRNLNIAVDASEKNGNLRVKALEIKLDDELVLVSGAGDSAKLLYDASELTDGPHTIQASALLSDNSETLSPPIIVLVNKTSGLTDLNTGDPPVNPPGTGPGQAPNPAPAVLPIIPPPPPGTLNPPSLLAQAKDAGIPTNDATISGQHSVMPVQSHTHTIVTPLGGVTVKTPHHPRSHGKPVSHVNTPAVHPTFEVMNASSDPETIKTEQGPTFHPVSAQSQAPRARTLPTRPPTASVPAPSASWIAPRFLAREGHEQVPATFSSRSMPLSPSSVVAPTRVILVQSPSIHPSTAPVLSALKPSLNRTSSNSADATASSVFVPVPLVVEPAPIRHSQRIAMGPPRTAVERTFASLKAHQPSAPEWLRVAYDDHWMNFDVQPMMVSGVAEMPFRRIFEASGAFVDWKPATQTVIADNHGRHFELKIGSRDAVVDHQVVQMIRPAFLRHGRTMVPLGFVKEALDLRVQFNQTTGEVVLTSKHVIAMVVK